MLILVYLETEQYNYDYQKDRVFKQPKDPYENETTLSNKYTKQSHDNSSKLH